jgi:hypothetical protein
VHEKQQQSMSPGAIRSWLDTPVSIAPLVTMRVIIGAMLFFSTLRFVALGWVGDHYVCPLFHFKYFGFEWVEPLPEAGMYLVHGLLMLSSLCVLAGWYFRPAALAQFLLFTYTELIDLTYYLNHYYFVSIACALLALTPAHRAFSVDARRNPGLFQAQVPRWTVLIFQLQLGIVYFYAGIWKINSDWLLQALPLKIWAPANDQLPLVGWLFKYEFTPWLFSWAGMLYDVTIVFWLLWPRTRLWAYCTVVFFHGITGMMFQIGVFPLVMMGATLVFFSEEWHNSWQNQVRMWAHKWTWFCKKTASDTGVMQTNRTPRWIFALLLAHYVFQLVFPWRYLLYPGNIFWTEEGYRFSWRVMLMEKAGTATFFVKDRKTGREGEVLNAEFLNPHQEKQMAMQPDMILQYAHFLKKHYEKTGMSEPSVRAEVYVTLNARPSQLLFDPQLDLTTLRDGWSHKTWIKPAPVASKQ